MIKKTALLSILIFSLNRNYSQDIHFSQSVMAPLQINPAMTGFFPGDQQIILNYKNQWQFIGAPYRTYALSVDAGLMKNKLPGAYLGAGLFLYSDKAGDVKYGTTQINAAASGIVKVNEHNSVSVGLEGGYVQKAMTGTDVKWGSQYQDGQYNSSVDPQEATSFNSFGYADFSTGVAWTFSSNAATMSSNDNILITGGFSFHHVNKPRLEFYLSEVDRLKSKGIFHLNAHIGFKNISIGLRPSLLYVRQGTQNEMIEGLLVRYRLNENSKYTGRIKESAISLGALYRNRDAVIPMMMFEYSSYSLGISYDITTSALTTYNNGRGGIEITIRYINPNPFVGGSKNSMF